ncbi:MAG: ABC transporter ATP-binding protein [Planctomycetota bacterium]
MIAAQGLSKRYGPVRALHDVSFDLPTGALVGLVGPNGAGKSTLLRLLTGCLRPTAGDARIDGASMAQTPKAARARVGYLPETSPLYPEMRVDAYLHFVGRLFGMRRADRRRRIDALTDRCGLGAIRHRVIGKLSRGNRQRVGVAQALLHEPPAIVLDEPTAGLDPGQSGAMRELLVSLRGHATVLVSSHILADVERLADRLLVIDQGALVHDGPPDTLRRALAGGAVRIEVRAEHAAVQHAMAHPAAVSVEPLAKTQAEAQSDAGWATYRVIPQNPERDLREHVAKALAAAGLPLRELVRESAPLDRLFDALKGGAQDTNASPAQMLAAQEPPGKEPPA